MKAFDLHIPLYYNDGSPIEPRKFQRLQKTLLEQFEGLTYFPQPNKGIWKLGPIIYHDEIVIYRVVTDKPGRSRRFLRKLRLDLEKDLKQEKILILGHKVEEV